MTLPRLHGQRDQEDMHMRMITRVTELEDILLTRHASVLVLFLQALLGTAVRVQPVDGMVDLPVRSRLAKP